MNNGIPNFIKVKRILNDKDEKNAKIEHETININDIKSFRAWHKGKNDSNVDGDMTIVLIKSEKKDESGNPKIQTIIINEKYEDFEDRISQRTVVK